MELNEIFKLLDAGFTKDEIMGLANPNTPAPAPEPEAPAEPIEAPKEEPKPQPSSYTLTQDQLQQLIQGVAKQTASGEIDLPEKIDEKLANRLQALIERK